MTTAHRPTYHPAVGSANAGGFRFHTPRQTVHSRDLTAHTKLKLRQPGQSSQQELQQRDLRQELIDRERKHALQAGIERRRITGEDEDEEEEEKAGGRKSSVLLLKSEEADSKDGEDAGQAEEEEEDDGRAVKLDPSAVDLTQFDDADAELSERDDDDESAHSRARTTQQ